MPGPARLRFEFPAESCKLAEACGLELGRFARRFKFDNNLVLIYSRFLVFAGVLRRGRGKGRGSHLVVALVAFHRERLGEIAFALAVAHENNVNGERPIVMKHGCRMKGNVRA